MRTAESISTDEVKSLFADLEDVSGLLLAVSGGPDSTALLWLAARWRKSLKKKPPLFAVTVDHGLRKESRKEALAVGKLAKKLGVPHRILKWTGAKPKTGIQQNARQARYRLLVDAAKKSRASHLLTAHTLDDQAETVLIRMARGSGITGLAAMARRSRLDGLILVRPLLDMPKERLVATLKAAKISYADDPSNKDPQFTRVRLRTMMPALASEGLDARRLANLARRLRRADAAIEAEVERVAAALTPPETNGVIKYPAADFSRLPPEIALRLIGRAANRLGDEGPVELGKLEALLAAAVPAAQKGGKDLFRRTLAGAVVTVAGGQVTVERAPPRRKAALRQSSQALTKQGARRSPKPKAL